MTSRSSLPRPESSLLGRGEELDRLARWIADGRRLVTLVGPGGVGKTRLAIALAHRMEATFPRGGAWFCDLTESRDALAVATMIERTLSSALMFGAARGVAPELADAIATLGRTLLVLDNCEQVTDGAASILRALLAGAPELVVVVTSREPLNLDMEQTLQVGPLEVPRADEAPGTSDAVLLFVERAQRARTSYCPTDRELRAVGTLVRHLDGLPLAIELAAARSKVMSVDRMLERIEQRLDLFRAASREVLPRQRTMRDAIGASWELLDEHERAGLRRCAVFRGGFDVAAAEAVIDAVPRGEGAPNAIDLVQSLRDKSLLRADEERGGLRLRFYETIHAFATEKLEQAGEVEAAQRAHALHFVALADATTSDPDRLRAFEPEIDNVLIANERCTARGDEDLFRVAALRLLRPFHPVLLDVGSIRLLPAFERTLALPMPDGAERGLRAELLVARGWLHLTLSNLEAGRVDLMEAARLAAETQQPVLEARARGRLGALLTVLGELEAAEAEFVVSLATFRREGMHVQEARTLSNYGALLQRRGALDEARPVYLRAIAGLRFAGEELVPLANLGLLEHERGHFDEAERLYAESSARAATRSRHRITGGLTGFRGLLAHDRGDLEAAAAHYERAAAQSKAAGHRVYGAFFLACNAVADAQRGRLADAEERHAMASEQLRMMGERVLLRGVDLAKATIDLHGRLDGPDATAILTRVEQTLEAARTARLTCPEVRILARVVARDFAALAKRARRGTLRVEADGALATLPDGRAMDLTNKKRLRALLVALAHAHLDRPGTAMPAAALMELAWPGDRGLARARINRLQVAIATLRRLGLDSLITTAQGYLLDPNVGVVLADVEGARSN